MERPYHHGTLRDSLVEGAIEELREHGRDRFSLRRTAMRAGVSHAAPAHHFRNADGLLTAVKAEGFARLGAAMEAGAKGGDAFERLVGAGLGYIALATEEPALFDVMFGPRSAGTSVEGESEPAAFELLLSLVEDARRAAGHEVRDAAFWFAVSTAWAVVHGYAQLATAGRMAYLDELGPDRERAVRDLLRRALSSITA